MNCENWKVDCISQEVFSDAISKLWKAKIFVSAFYCKPAENQNFWFGILLQNSAENKNILVFYCRVFAAGEMGEVLRGIGGVPHQSKIC